METTQRVRDLRARSWRNSKGLAAAVQDAALQQGKRAVVKTKGDTFRKYVCTSSTCSWFVDASFTRHKQKESSWHVTNSSVEHINCTEVSRPTQRQVVASAVMRSSVAADNSASVLSLSNQLKLQAGFQCKASLVSRAKEQILEGMFAEDSASIQELPSYLNELSRINSNLHTEIQRDVGGRFDKAVIVLDSKMFTNRQQIFGVDAAHMKHRNYNGVQLILVVRDGNMENKIASVALVPVENAENYKWLFDIIISRGYPLSTIPMFSDRHTGILAAAEALTIRVFFALVTSSEAFVWGAQASVTKARYDKWLDMLEGVNINASRYLKALNPVQWALYPHHTSTPLCGWRTTNFVESEQARSLRLKSRKMLPYEYFRTYSKILMSECFERISQADEWAKSDRVVTPRADAKLQQELKRIPDYEVAFSSSLLEINLEVHLVPPFCPCLTWTQFGLPCRHLLAVLDAAYGTERAMGMSSKCYATPAYSENLNPIRLLSDDLLVQDEQLLPAPCINQAGRPRERRLRSRGEERTRAVYRRKKYGVKDGHTKATCRHK